MLQNTKCLYSSNLLYEPVCPSLSHSVIQSDTNDFMSALYHLQERSENLLDYMLQSSSINLFVYHSVTTSVSQSLTIFARRISSKMMLIDFASPNTNCLYAPVKSILCV